MTELFDALGALAVAVRDWATLFFAFLAALYAWLCREEIRRRHRLFANGDAEAIGEKTLQLRIRLRNETPTDISVTRIMLRRPRPAILAMEGVYEPGPGPIICNHSVPAFETGCLTVLVGSRGNQQRTVRLRLRYRRTGHFFPRSLAVAIDPRTKSNLPE